jgi:molybdopterin-containing oxidoreductase family iron-sulfur binding subunit
MKTKSDSLRIIEPEELWPTGCAPQAVPLWRSLDELTGGEPLRTSLGSRFPDREIPILDASSRRQFLRLMGASLALSGLAGCAVEPLESIVPYVEQPESIVPGKPLFFATAVPFGESGTGVLVESHMGRPVKIEGNPSHPSSEGATDGFTQAEILSLYDPDRSQVVLSEGRVSTWERFLVLAVDLREQKRKTQGRGLRILTRSVASPTLADQLHRLLGQFPRARWHIHEPVSHDAIREGSRLAFGEVLEPFYDLRQADVIVALDADFLSWGPDRLRHTRDFTARRDVEERAQDAPRVMNRLYAVECTPTLTGAAAEHRVVVKASQVARVAQAIARELDVLGASVSPETFTASHAGWISAMIRDLKNHEGRCVVLAGAPQPPEVHALAYAINERLGNFGKTVSFLSPDEPGSAGQTSSLDDLVKDIHQGEVDALLILDANPVYEAPIDLDFKSAVDDPRLALRIHLGPYNDETAELCHWHIPRSHFLESWSDVRFPDGTVTIQQPLIAPLYQGHSPHEVIEALLGEPGRPDLEIVRNYWKRHLQGPDFEKLWHQSLVDGRVAGTKRSSTNVKIQRHDHSHGEPAANADQGGLELVFRPDPTIWDGRFANNGWLQELPKPLTRLTWGNAALISPELASRLGLSNEEVVELRYRGRTLNVPVWITPGQSDGSVTLSLGHGRWRAGRIGTGVGYSAYRLRTTDAPWFGDGLELVKTAKQHPLAPTQHHFTIAGRDMVRVAHLEAYRREQRMAETSDQAEPQSQSLYPDPPRGQDAENAWGMTIDLNRCIGCGACVVACQAENNIPIVGKEEVLRSREMHWLRVDRYYEGADASNPKTYFQPVPCMHCEKAPCELVCPVGATTHSDEGLNEMTYNRCVGTRYCSNNCPYKVRRFNFLQYSNDETPSLKLLRNPDVTVRSRGVMEKCTYCVQRINQARIDAKIEDRAVGGDEVVTACQAVCPARAIVFGNLRDPQSRVARTKESPRNYALLAELNTLPRTTYLARIQNPNPEIEPA